nr:uncharacterized protein LOC129264140 [Lytechinus pictus]
MSAGGGGGSKRKRGRRRNKPTTCKDSCENADEDLIQLECQEQEDSPGTSREGNAGSSTDKPSRDQSSRDLSSSKCPSYSKRKGKIRLKGKSSCRDADDNVCQPKSWQHEDSLTTSATVSSTPNLGTDQSSSNFPSSNFPSFSKRRKKGRSRKASQHANSQPDPNSSQQNGQCPRTIFKNSSSVRNLEVLHPGNAATASTFGTRGSPDDGSVHADSPHIQKKVAEIPGFYYDEEKKRYFRILPGHSGGNVVTTETIRQKAAEKKRQCYFDKRYLVKGSLRKVPTIKVVKSLVQLQENKRRGNCRSSYFKRAAHETAVRQMEIKPSSRVSPFPDQYFSGSSGYISKFELDSRQKHVLMVFSDNYLSRLWQGEVVRRRSPKTGQEEVTIANWSKVNILNTQNTSKVTHASWAQVREGENMYALYAYSGGSSNTVQLVKCPTDEDGVAHISYSYKCISNSAWTCAWSNSPTLPAHLAIGSDKKALVIDTLSSRDQPVYTGRSDVFAQAFSRKDCLVQCDLSILSSDVYAAPTQRPKYSGSNIYYYPNCTASYQLLLRAGDICPNPGRSVLHSPSNENSRSSSRSVSTISGTVFNARSIRHKMPDLIAHLSCNPTDILCICESWLNESCDSTELGFPHDYVLFRRDRQDIQESHEKGGGGVLTVIHAKLCPRRLVALEHPCLEMTCVEIVMRKSKWLLITIYRPPNANVQYWDFLQEFIDDTQRYVGDYAGVILTGDLNVDLLDINSTDATRLLTMLSTMDLTQLVDTVTRPSPQDATRGTLIDHLFTNRRDLFAETRCVLIQHLVTISPLIFGS